MTGQQLKNSILQLAIQGKLVPQIESEGTAEDLLKEIRAEKEKLVKEGKLKKKDLEVKPIEDDDIPRSTYMPVIVTRSLGDQPSSSSSLSNSSLLTR